MYSMNADAEGQPELGDLVLAETEHRSRLLGQARGVDQVEVGVPAGVPEQRHDDDQPSSAVSIPARVRTRISAAHTAIGTGLAITRASSSASAAQTPRGGRAASASRRRWRRTSGAASTPPSRTQLSKSKLSFRSTTTRRKSVGLRTGASAKPVINDAEVSTQPVPASANNRKGDQPAAAHDARPRARPDAGVRRAIALG